MISTNETVSVIVTHQTLKQFNCTIYSYFEGFLLLTYPGYGRYPADVTS